MINFLKEGLWTQFGASIDMLKNAITEWPDEQWHANKRFFYIAYHTLIFLDYYLNVPLQKMSSPLSFTLTGSGDIPAEAVDDIVPDNIYSKKELLDYLQANRDKCYQVINGLTEELLNERWLDTESNRHYGIIEQLLYNMRHVQHHTAQLNMLLRQTVNSAPDWVAQAK